VITEVGVRKPGDVLVRYRTDIVLPILGHFLDD